MPAIFFVEISTAVVLVLRLQISSRPLMCDARVHPTTSAHSARSTHWVWLAALLVCACFGVNLI